MAREKIQRAACAIAGLVVGYVVWLGLASCVAATTPVHLWAAVAAILLVLFSIAAVVAGRRSATPPARYFFWASPLLPALASIYVLVVVAF
ncbi:hypothetical protein ACQ86B_28335 (plasmid) [Mycolicibacterium aichiense]|uniref:hypothetical protein n=1 Tax=Mycolicibacterium aichiense TaxID=1799 RepID=UPI003D66EED9